MIALSDMSAKDITATASSPASTEEWLAARLSGIGASEAAAVLGRSPWKSNIDLWREKTGRRKAEDISDKDCVAYGHAAEEHLRALFALDYPRYEVTYGGAFDMVKRPETPYIFATLDGRLVEKETGRRGVLEIKTTSIVRSMQKEKWWGPQGPCIPDQYYIQICHQLLATGWDFAVLHAQLKYDYSDGIRSERRTYFIERSEVQYDIDYLLEEETKFWCNYVLADREPPLILPEI